MAEEAGDSAETSDQLDVFISHSAQDFDTVKYIADGLKKEGLTTFCSTADQRPATTAFNRQIAEKLSFSRIVLGIQSPNALESDWVVGEWKRGRRKQKLMFARIEEVDEDHHELLQYEFLHYADLISMPFPLSGGKWEQFLEAVQAEVAERRIAERERQEAIEAEGASAESKEEARTDQAGEIEITAAKPLPSIQARQEENIGSLLERDPDASPTNRRGSAKGKDARVSSSGFSETPIMAFSDDLDLGVSAADWCLLDGKVLVQKALKTTEPNVINDYARSGQADAQALVGLAHLLRNGPFPRDFEIAGRWFDKAAEKGFARAQAELAVLIAAGDFARFDMNRVDDLTTEAAASGCPRAKTLRALLRQTGTRLPSLPFDKSFALLEEAHRAGDLLATTHLGWSLLQGRGRRHDVPRGFELLQDAARAKEHRAMTYLGMAFARGRGTSRNIEKAAHWFRSAANAGDLLGLIHFAWCNEVGAGAARDAVAARQLYSQAVERGSSEAMVRLAKMCLFGRGGTKDESRAISLLERASDLGEAEATSRLGEVYADGIGVERNLAKAATLFEDAAEQDQPWALWRLGQLYEDGNGVERDREYAIDLYRRAAFNAADRKLYLMAMARLDRMAAPLRKTGG